MGWLIAIGIIWFVIRIALALSPNHKRMHHWDDSTEERNDHDHDQE